MTSSEMHECFRLEWWQVGRWMFPTSTHGTSVRTVSGWGWIVGRRRDRPCRGKCHIGQPRFARWPCGTSAMWQWFKFAIERYSSDCTTKMAWRMQFFFGIYGWSIKYKSAWAGGVTVQMSQICMIRGVISKWVSCSGHEYLNSSPGLHPPVYIPCLCFQAWSAELSFEQVRCIWILYVLDLEVGYWSKPSPFMWTFFSSCTRSITIWSNVTTICTNQLD
jgi:hypothetical protein